MRRLDYTYYNLLEKVSDLDSSIASLQDLLDSTRALASEFQRESSDLDLEIRRQLDDFKGFASQAEQVHALEERMKSGMKKAEVLGNRLRTTGDELDELEKKNLGLQSRVTQRFRMFWTAVAFGVLSLVVVMVLRDRKSHHVYQ